MGLKKKNVSNGIIRHIWIDGENSRHAHREAINHEFVVKWLEDIPAYERMVDTRIPITLEIGQLVLANVHHFGFFASLVGIIINKWTKRKETINQIGESSDIQLLCRELTTVISGIKPAVRWRNAETLETEAEGTGDIIAGLR